MRARGFTLLEVLVALAVVAIGLVAAFGQLGQSVRTVDRLRDKTFAYWIATDRLTEIRLNAQSRGAYPPIGDTSDEVEMAGVNWRYKVKVSESGVEDVRRVQVSVGPADQPGNDLAVVTGAVAKVSMPAAGTLRGTEWMRLVPGEIGNP